MATTNRERVEKALDLLRSGLAPYVQRELERAVRVKSLPPSVLGGQVVHGGRSGTKTVAEMDVAALLSLMWSSWHDAFRQSLGPAERGFVGEMRGLRNRWAHQEQFSGDDAYRTLDTASRLLTAVSAKEAGELDKLKMELLRVRFDEQARTQQRRRQTTIAAGAAAHLKPWRQVVSPHPDVAAGLYLQADFAADLWQVHIGEAASEYRDPVEFFRRTFLTDSLKGMLLGAMHRLAGRGGDPVVQLQTNFGGGKTHSMLALYHLCSGVRPSDLPGVDAVTQEPGLANLPKVRRVVLVGNRISPGSPETKPDGTKVRTLWGELAWQLGGAEAYVRIARDDELATSPGDALRQLLVEHGPCLILIDEWVAYARQLHERSDLPAGSFETQFTFAQALTESAKAAGNCVLVVSLPASDTPGASPSVSDSIEVGGLRGKEALDRLGNVVGRIESSWRPATAEEGFEIVRRRLFEPMTDPAQYKDRDVVAREFAQLYRGQRHEFPSECRDADYEQRLKAAYPIHPEVFDRLHTDWSTLPTFQRTRGVLRLMAAVIHSLWERGESSPLILPANVSVDDLRVQSELTRYLPENWRPVIEKDVDGAVSLPQRLDGEVANLGKFRACQRVGRTVFLGSAPSAGAAQRGLDGRRIRLGCVFPGESSAVFGDALRRLAENATYLYQDGSRYWYDTRPTVTKLAEDRAEELRGDPDRVAKAIVDRLRVAVRETGGFSRIHVAPQSGHEVPDERETRLVVLGDGHPYARGGESPAEAAAEAIFESRGASPRLYRNAVVFLAADRVRLDDLDQAVRFHLAWESILAEREELDLSPHQVRQAETRCRSAQETVSVRLPETYKWLLSPVQGDPHGAMTWEAVQLQTDAPLAVRAARRLQGDELLFSSWSGTRLRMVLDQVPLWRDGDHVSVAQLVEDFARYVYLPRMLSPTVLLNAAGSGVGLLTWERETFGYADSHDEEAERYRGLRWAENVALTDPSGGGLLVKPAAARRQIDREAVKPPGGSTGDLPGAGAGGGAAETDTGGAGTVTTPADSPETGPTRFHGSVALDPTRAGRDASRIAEEVIAHLAGMVGADVQVTLEIRADIPAGASDQVVRTVSENSRTLKFSSHGFEREQ